MFVCPTCHERYDESRTTCPADGSTLVAAPVTEPLRSVTPRDAPTNRGRAGAARMASPSPAGAAVAAVQVAPSVEIEAGDVIGEYHVIGRIGEGGMGTVFAGIHPVIGKKVAIKVLNAALSHDQEIVDRFAQEARAVNQIAHRNIVDIFAFGQLPTGRHYCVMEFLEGRSLRARLSRPPALTHPEVFTLLGDVLDALAAAHAEGIVHRDLKPDNVFLVEDKSGGFRTKLLDFGVAKLLRRPSEIGRTRTGAPLGTPFYMSPEQCRNRAIDVRTDIYAIGVIMFEVFTGQLPFPGPEYIDTVNGHLSRQPPRPSALQLTIVSDPPGARVTVDGQEQPGTTPLALSRPWSSSIAVGVDKVGFESAEATLHPLPGQAQVARTFTLTASTGDLFVAATAPNAHWFLDGAPRGEGPSLRVEHLTPGSHVVRVEAEHYASFERGVQVDPGRLTSLEWTLTPLPKKRAHHDAALPDAPKSDFRP